LEIVCTDTLITLYRVRVQDLQSSDKFRVIVKHQYSVTGVALSDDDSRGFSVSKDGTILHWDVSSGKSDVYKWPSDEVLKSHGLKFQESWNTRHNKQSLALAVSSDGRYLATGGVDCHVHLWDIRTREHVQVNKLKNNQVKDSVHCVLLSASLIRYVSIAGFYRSQWHCF